MLKKHISIGIICIFIGLFFSSNIIADNQDEELIETNLVSYDSLWEYNTTVGGWCIEFPAITINDSIVWSTEILDAYVAYLSFTHEYDFESYYYYNSSSDEEYEYEAKGYLELSSDGGDTWYILGLYSGDSTGSDDEVFDISYWAFNQILIRFRAVGVGDDYFANESGGSWCIWDLKIFGMVDDTPPVSTIEIASNGQGPWSSSPIQITITAYDDASGVKEIHYKLNDLETVVAGDYFYHDLRENGWYNLEFWAIDFAGNEEFPHHTILPFGIDMESPNLDVIEPLSGIYLFGKRILPANQLIIFGNFTIKADAYDNLSGIVRVIFLLNGDVLGVDTEEPYEMNCAVKHSGEGRIKVIAMDNAGCGTEEIFDVYYYKFF